MKGTAGPVWHATSFQVVLGYVAWKQPACGVGVRAMAVLHVSAACAVPARDRQSAPATPIAMPAERAAFPFARSMSFNNFMRYSLSSVVADVCNRHGADAFAHARVDVKDAPTPDLHGSRIFGSTAPPPDHVTPAQLRLQLRVMRMKLPFDGSTAGE